LTYLNEQKEPDPPVWKKLTYLNELEDPDPIEWKKLTYLNELEEVGHLMSNVDSLVLPVIVHVSEIFQGPAFEKQIFYNRKAGNVDNSL
jgi:hypothetical protein